MTFIKTKSLLSLLLALVMVVTMFPMAALAAEETGIHDAEVCSDENCTHDHTEASEEIPATPDTEEPTAAETPVPKLPPLTDVPETPSPKAGEKALVWEFDADRGKLYIGGSGAVGTVTSADDQPWATVRESIITVCISDYDGLTVDSIAYWFSGCINLEYAEIPASVREIGYHAFYNCQSLHDLILYHDVTVPNFVSGAFITNHPLVWQSGYDPRLQIKVSDSLADEMLNAICDYDWHGDNCPVHAAAGSGLSAYAPMASASTRAVGYCSFCKTTCSYTVAYEQWTDYDHCVRRWCSNCGYDQCGGVCGEAHVYSHYNSSYDRCTYCGYLTACTCGGGGGSVCYHYSTYISWSGCDWYKYCSSCGKLMDSGTSHGSTYTSRSGCNWYEYCNNCGGLVNSGISHGPYNYGSWEYYDSSRHRRYYYCSGCGEGSYEYDYHSSSTRYSPYNATQHSYGSYCSTCGSYTGSTFYANHSFNYGNWTSCGGTQHRRLKTCSQCGYSEYEYVNHTLAYGSWTNYSASQHRRTANCSVCGYSSYEYASHSYNYGNWTSVSGTQHSRSKTCSCGYGTTEYVDHTLVYGDWTPYSDTQHRRTISCSGCSYSVYDCGEHADTNGDGQCDDCGYEMTRFSVTVPVSLTLTVSNHGEVYSANNAAIINNSTGAVEITGVTVSTANGWTLVPYSSNMAAVKVDSKLIGFALNGAQSVVTGMSEALSLPSSWSIAKGCSLPLSYDAVVSAMSRAVNEQVLTVVFVLEWAVS